MISSIIAKRVLSACLAMFALSSATLAASVTYDGITFPDGNVSFADSVVSYTPGSGFTGTALTNCQDASLALGAPDYVSGDCDGYVSLGDGGTLILQFTDNLLRASGTTDADLHIFEVGTAVEAMVISISANGSDWFALGTLSGQPTSIDIDATSGINAGDEFSFVRIVDAPGGATGGVFSGADIDAVGAISTTVVPLPAGLWFGLAGLGALAALRRRKTA